MTWTPQYASAAPWSIERLGVTLRITEDGLVRVIESLDIRIIEMIERTSWSNEYGSATAWTKE